MLLVPPSRAAAASQSARVTRTQAAAGWNGAAPASADTTWGVGEVVGDCPPDSARATLIPAITARTTAGSSRTKVSRSDHSTARRGRAPRTG